MSVMETILIWTAVLVTVGQCYKYTEPDLPPAPDKVVVSQIGQAVWDNRQEILNLAADSQWWMDDDVINMIQGYLDQVDSQPEELITCLQCRTFLATLKSFNNQGLEFADIRDFAVDVCYNVTPSLGWNGEVMCEGIIDVFGPHVYWVVNQTDLSPDEICQFHFQCPVDEIAPRRSLRRPDVQAPSTKTHRRSMIKQQQIIKVAHITDVHLDENYTPGAPTDCDSLPICCRDYLPGTGSASEWGEYGCALSIPTMNVILKTIADLDVDLVINTGDTPNHALWEETQEGQLRQSELLVNGIKEYIPGVPTHVCLGNHDTYPTNLFYGPSPYIKDLLTHLRSMYQDLANFTAEQIETFEDSGYYTTLLTPGLRLMAYNSEYGYTDNYYGVLLEDTPQWKNMTQFMEDTFDYARANGEKILLISHHGMGGGFTFWHDFITDIMDRNGDLVILHLFGHTHSDNYKMGLDEDGNAFHVNIITSAMTSQRNPAFKIFYVDTATMIPTGFDVYFLNLSRPIGEGAEPVIELMYSSLTDYSMPDLTPSSFQNFTDRMEVDDDLFNLFRWNENSRHSIPGPCEGDCKKSYLCSRRSVSRQGYNDCMSA